MFVLTKVSCSRSFVKSTPEILSILTFHILSPGQADQRKVVNFKRFWANVLSYWEKQIQRKPVPACSTSQLFFLKLFIYFWGSPTIALFWSIYFFELCLFFLFWLFSRDSILHWILVRSYSFYFLSWYGGSFFERRESCCSGS